ncbi:hypothetical protein KP509_32G044200 [Ceratopteris richardii]|uniref:rRNA methylase n=1 Tax=Ceratopteris richardii TaxID=49495 RepID=A0A8T2QUH0_CERRI|nr:hypothetical protein KP509_32G044200 [Ceratopteris richardii]
MLFAPTFYILIQMIWRQVISVGDTVVDATCGNGHDTAILAKLALGENNEGVVHGFDLQSSAIEKTSSLLDKELSTNQRKRVYLHHTCHSKLGQVIKEKNFVSVVAFNLGYLPGGEKGITTASNTTVEALMCATSLVKHGGIITLVSYIGHPGGRDEYEAVRDFATRLASDKWICSHWELLNRPLCPRLLVLLKK